jgi:hypothetical protein
MVIRVDISISYRGKQKEAVFGKTGHISTFRGRFVPHCPNKFLTIGY